MTDSEQGAETDIDGDTAKKAIRTAASFAEDADELRVFMDMLGLTPSKPWAKRHLIDNSPARRHIRFLRETHDIPAYRIAKAAHLSPNTVMEIARGVPASRRRVVSAILAVTPEDCKPKVMKCLCGEEFDERRRPRKTRCRGCSLGRSAAGPSREHLLALRESMPCGQIAQLCGVGADALRRIGHLDPAKAQRFVLPATEERILAVPIPKEVAA